MPPKKSIIVDDEKILAAIRDAYLNDVEAVQKRLAELEAEYELNRDMRLWDRVCNLRRRLSDCEEGIRNDLARWWGREPTASERIRLQQCVRRLEAAGLVERSTIYIRPINVSPVPLEAHNANEATTN